jgi:hypothetical protein
MADLPALHDARFHPDPGRHSLWVAGDTRVRDISPERKARSYGLWAQIGSLGLHAEALSVRFAD